MGDASSKLESSGSDIVGEHCSDTTTTVTTPSNGDRFSRCQSTESRQTDEGSEMSVDSDVTITQQLTNARTRFQQRRLDTAKSLPAVTMFDSEDDSSIDQLSVDDVNTTGDSLIGDTKTINQQPRKRSFSVNDSHNLLEAPLETRPSSPIHFEDDSLASDDDANEEVMILPRNRINSLGSISVYSVKEVSDNLYKDYFRRIKLFLKSQGVFERFPTPSLLSEAQKLYQRMELPTPIDDNERILPHPPRFTLQEAFSNKTKTEEIKERLLNFQTPVDLTSKLQVQGMAARLCKDMKEDIQRVVTIATWLLCQYSHYLSDAKSGKPSAEDVCKVFHIMCKSSKIKSKLVRGIVRGPDFIPGKSTDSHRGIWISVLIDTTWCLIDPYSKMSLFEEKTANLSKPLFDYIDQYIAVVENTGFLFEEPVKFIFTHFPDEEYWQLLARSVSKEELSELALLREGFFDMELNILKQPKSLLMVDGRSSVISLSWTDERVPQFKCNFSQSDDKVKDSEIISSETHPDVDLKRYVYLETNVSKRVMNTYIRYPHIGEYLLDIYGSFEEGVYHKISSYRFIYASYQKSDPFPKNTREEWGPGLDTYALGLTPVSHHSGEIIFTSNVLQIEFKDNSNILFETNLLKDGKKYTNDDIKLAYLKDNDNAVTFIVDFPQDKLGDFVFQIFATKNENEEAKNCCNYLLRKEKSNNRPRFLFDKDTNDDIDAIIAPDSGTMQLEIDCENIVELSVELKLKLNYEKMVSEHTRYWILDKKGIVDLNFPWKGKYIVRVHGRCSKKSREKLLRSETIRVEIPSEQWSPFPKVLEYWHPQLRLLSPLYSHWQEKVSITLCVDVPGAHDVAVVSPGGWYHLNLQENGEWKGQVWTGAKSTKCKLEARFEKGSDMYSSLLWFKVISEYDFKINERRQVELRKVALKKAGLST